MPVWNSEEENERETFIIFVEDDEIEVEGEITAEKVKDVASSHRIADFHVRDTSGHQVGDEIFPIKENVVISPINKAG